jgi:hypothetical protein
MAVKYTAGHDHQSVVVAIHQTSHGLAIGNVVKRASSAYSTAQADSAANANVIGIVSASSGADDFVITTEGYVTGLSGLTDNTVYYLHPTSAGALTDTEPATVGQVRKPLLIADSTTSGYFHITEGEIVGAGVSAHAASHEDGGADEIDITALAGYVAPPSPYTSTPEAASGAGDDGSSSDYAKGDHVHPAAAASGTIQRQEYTSGSGNFTASYTGLHRITLIGAGGGGGKASDGGGGGGGGAGGHVIALPVFLLSSSTTAYSVGASGTAGTSAGGGTGGDTTFGGLTASGGEGGAVGAAAAGGAGGAGGTVTTAISDLGSILGGTGGSAGASGKPALARYVNSDSAGHHLHALPHESGGSGGGGGATGQYGNGGAGGASYHKSGFNSAYGSGAGGGGGHGAFSLGGAGAGASDGAAGSYGSGGAGGALAGGGVKKNGGAGGSGYILIEWWA